MKKIHILIFAIAMLFSTSCLEKYPNNALLESDSMQTISDAEQTINGIYAGFKSSALYSGYLTLVPDLQSDLALAVDGYTNSYGNIWSWSILPNDTYITSIYAQLYTIIGRCNFFLEKAPQVERNLRNDADLDAMELYKGEAYFARALCYSELIRLYCNAYDPAKADSELGVVLKTSWSERTNQPRASIKEAYGLVLADLKQDEECITTEGDNETYLTKGSINAIYARVYLYMQDWDNAITYSTNVINDSTYTLANASTQYTSSDTYFTYMWNYDSAFEIIWKIGFTTTSYGGALGTTFLNYNYVAYYPDYIASQWVLDSYDYNDLRYNAYFTSVQTGYPHRLSYPLLTKYLGNQTFIAQNILGVNMPKPFRMAEQYLIRAEAYGNKGNYSAAGADLSTLRAARYSSGGSVALNSANWLSYIKSERVKELYMEGFRLSDLKRWGDGFERKAQSNTISPGNKLNISASDPLFTWPIPQHELESPGSLVQPNASNK